jgi:hypothetical protein
MAARTITTRCTIDVEHSADRLEAHVELAGAPDIRPGDRVLVHGAPIHVTFGERLRLQRDATIVRAGWLTRLWTRVSSRLELAELYEVSFTPRRTL